MSFDWNQVLEELKYLENLRNESTLLVAAKGALGQSLNVRPIRLPASVTFRTLNWEEIKRELEK